MSLRDSLIPVVDGVRQAILVEATGLRFRSVKIRTRTWSGTEPGGGEHVDELADLEPRPRVRDPDPRLVASSAGTYVDGDRIVDRVSATYTRAQLEGTPGPAQLVHWLIDDVEYTLVQLEERTFEWRAHLRPLRGRG